MGNSNRTLDSSGPDVKIRGTAMYIYDRYQTLARDASSTGDRIAAENYLQHAEHYYRLMAAQGLLNPQNGGGDRPNGQPGGGDGQPEGHMGQDNGQPPAMGEGMAGEQPVSGHADPHGHGHGGHRQDGHRQDGHRQDSHRQDSHRQDSHRQDFDGQQPDVDPDKTGE